MGRGAFGAVIAIGAAAVVMVAPATAKTPTYKSSVKAEIAARDGVAVNGNVSSKFADCERRKVNVTVTFSDGSTRALDGTNSYNEGRFSVLIPGVPGSEADRVQSAFVDVLAKLKGGKKPYKCKPTSTTAFRAPG